jgi:serine phosphatase RsbU (regulator of sigma subunit)
MIVKSLHQTGKEEETKDGMDISMCMIDKKKKALQYAGAYNSIYILRNGELIEASADRMPVGFHDKMDVPFTTQNIPLQKGDVIYMFSDGYVSQFGGEAGKKFMAKRFKELITSISQLTMEEQKQKLDDAIESWRGPLDQVDDLLVLGFKF